MHSEDSDQTARMCLNLRWAQMSEDTCCGSTSNINYMYNYSLSVCLEYAFLNFQKIQIVKQVSRKRHNHRRWPINRVLELSNFITCPRTSKWSNLWEIE